MVSDSKPIRRRKLSDEVQERLLALIKELDLKPGDSMPSERELMSAYGVGRPAIREAMQALQRMGLVDIRHGERPRIAEPALQTMLDQMAETMRHLLAHSRTTLEHLKEARAVFEAQMASIAAQNRTEADVRDLENILDRQAAVRDDSAVFLVRDGDFHAKIAAMSGNPIFASLSRALFDWLAEFHVNLVRKPGLEQLTLDEHSAILDSIRHSDPQQAAQRMADHLNRANTLYHKDNI